jgi:hypothetical protein
MRLDATVLADGTIVGTVDCQPHLEHPLGHAVPQRYVMLRHDEPKLSMPLQDGTTVEFHISSTFGVLIHARCLSTTAAVSVATAQDSASSAQAGLIVRR